jgi:hypothetical protein
MRSLDFGFTPFGRMHSIKTMLLFLLAHETLKVIEVTEAGYQHLFIFYVQGGSNMTGTNCDLFTHNQSRSYLNHLVCYM